MASAVLAMTALALALMCAGTFAHLLPQALHGAGTSGMVASAILLLAAAAGLGCLYLALIWTLAAVAAAGRSGRGGRVSLQVLRVLAPALARRLAVGAATTAAVGTLALSPALATDSSAWDEQAGPAPAPIALPMGGTGVARSAAGAELEVLPIEGDSARDAGPGDVHVASEGKPGAGAPSRLGWADPAPVVAAGADQDAGPEVPDPTSVVVRPGDSLWSITDDLLGPGADDDARIAAVWPELYAVNSRIIGPDPDLIEPGMVLAVPVGVDAAAQDEAPTAAPGTDQQEES
ncbi:LysM peptidoglycan-binding domain-containing protein [Brachybacterium hainanense]|uniref:LysM peptidoglycan-binding domain-containing protein n=1 Tax=Brachybacterium hainanense TaxID=1541174 RepID=A0ABV6RBX6_9MICO